MVAPGWRIEPLEADSVVLRSPEGLRVPEHGSYRLERPITRPGA